MRRLPVAGQVDGAAACLVVVVGPSPGPPVPALPAASAAPAAAAAARGPRACTAARGRCMAMRMRLQGRRLVMKVPRLLLLLLHVGWLLELRWWKLRRAPSWLLVRLLVVPLLLLRMGWVPLVVLGQPLHAGIASSCARHRRPICSCSDGRLRHAPSCFVRVAEQRWVLESACCAERAVAGAEVGEAHTRHCAHLSVERRDGNETGTYATSCRAIEPLLVCPRVEVSTRSLTGQLHTKLQMRL